MSAVVWIAAVVTGLNVGVVLLALLAARTRT